MERSIWTGLKQQLENPSRPHRKARRAAPEEKEEEEEQL